MAYQHPNREEIDRRQTLKEQLHATFDEKGLISLHDRRRVMRGLLGRDCNMSTIENDEIEQLLVYMKSKRPDELQSKIIGWFSITPLNQGMSKFHMRELMKEFPSTVEVTLVSVQADADLEHPLSVYGFIQNTFYQENETMILHTLTNLQKEAPAPLAPGTYTLDYNMQLTLLDDRVPFANSKRRRI